MNDFTILGCPDIKTPLDVKIHLQFEAHMVSNRLLNAAKADIEKAVLNDDAQLDRIISNWFHQYNDVQHLIKYFQVYGENPYSDNIEMQDVFNLSKEQLLFRVSDEVKQKLKSKGYIQ